MKVTVKDIQVAYGVLNEAKMGKMETTDQIKVIKALRQLKGIMTPFQEFVKDAQEKLKGEHHEEMAKKQERKDLTAEERQEVNEYAAEYNSKVNECVKEEWEKEHEVNFSKLSEEAFGKLMHSNEWTASQAMAVQDLICE